MPSNTSLSFAAAAAAGAAAAEADAFGVGRVNTRSRAASAAASAAASRAASRGASPPRAEPAHSDDCRSLAAALCAKLAPLAPKKRAAASAAESAAKTAKTATSKTAPEALREASLRAAEEIEDDDNSGSAPRRKRTPAQVHRANNVNIVRRALDENIKVLLGESKEPARPLPADRFTEDELSSILCCKGYKFAIGFDVPLFIADIEEPIYTNTASSRSAYAKMMPLSSATFDAIASDDYASQRAAAAKLCAPTKAYRQKRATFASSASSASASKAAPFAIRLGVPACLNGHALMALAASRPDREVACSICGCGCRDFKSCSDIACRSSSTISDSCIDYVAPNTQAAFFIVAAAEHQDADFDHADAITALGKLSTSNGNVVPLDGRQIAGFKLHREADDDAEIEGNQAAITTSTRDILLKALTHTHNTPETAFDTQLKANTLAAAVTTSDAAIAALRTKLQRMETEAADLKRIHATTAHMVACNKLRAVGQLPQSPVVSGKEKAVLKRISFAPTAAAAESSEDSDSDSDSDDNQPPVNTYVFGPNDSDDDA